jgi:Ran GTPase-activating protein (RanGAP) involved in mRNA processing and transport
MAAASPPPPASPRLPFGLTQEQLRNELYTAWRKDSREPQTAESYKRYRGFADAGFRDKEVVIRRQDVGINFALCLSSLLARSNVTKIDLYGNALHDSGAEAVAHLLREAPTLTHLNLGANDIGALGITSLAPVIAGHKKLQVLVLGSGGGADQNVNRVDPACAKTLLEACTRCKTLKWLDLNRNPLGRGSQEAFTALQQFIAASPNLQVLKLGETEATTESVLGVIDAARRSSSLSELHLHGNRLHARVGEALGQLMEERGRRVAPSALKTLNLQVNPTLGSAGTAAIFKGLTVDKGLTTLDLCGCNVDDESVMILCDALDSNAALTSLNLSANAITDVGAAEIARSVATHPALQHLDLSKNKVRDDGGCALAGMLEMNKTLDTLELTDAWIGDRGAIAIGVALANNTTLHHLHLDNNHVSEDGGSALVALLDRNTALLHCSFKGNSIFHNTLLQLSKVVQRNQAAKEAEIPNQRRRQVVRLHYQLYKLDEAKSEFDVHRTKKNEIERERERFDAQFREEELDFHKRRKELEDALRDQDASCTSIDGQLRKLQEDFSRFTVTNGADVQLLEDRLASETAERKKAEAEFQRVQAQIKLVEGNRQDKIDELLAKIEEAKDDRFKWSEQTAALRKRGEELQETIKKLEGQLANKDIGGATAVGEASVRAAPGKGGAAARKKSTAGGNQEAINALLGK